MTTNPATLREVPILLQIRQEIAHDLYYQQNFANDGQRFVAWYLRRVLLRHAIAADPAEGVVYLTVPDSNMLIRVPLQST